MIDNPEGMNTMKRRPILAGNWKMNHNVNVTRDTVTELRASLSDIDDVDIVVCPVFTSLAVAAAAAEGSVIHVGAQNVHWAASGAFTGEVSAGMLTEIPVRYVVIGHSERRQYFGETDENVNKRLRAALDHDLIPIVCVGEVLEQRQAGETESVVSAQIAGCLDELSKDDMLKTVIAYEPVWAIGTGVTATPAQAQDVHAFIRKRVAQQFDKAVADVVRIQYGGSVKPGNVAELMAEPDIDGALVGGASLKAADFSALVKAARS